MLTDGEAKDATILMLAERLYICSRLLTRAAERLGWDDEAVQQLVEELRDSVRGGVRSALTEATGE